MQRPNAPSENQQFDLLVCGGGIYGAWTAYDAALRGLKVILVEQNDWASGTSSASSKLIHGGLRYLETLDFGVVKKSLQERQRLINAGPYRVWPLRFGVPVNQQSRIGSWRLQVGLTIYDLLAGIFHSQQKHLRFSAGQFLKRFPGLDETGLKCGYTYLDAQTDDARLVLEIIDGAISAGAICLNYCQASELLEHNGVINGAVLNDKINGKKYTIKTSAVVKTTGQWIFPEKHWCRLSKGVHLVLPKILENEALLLTARSDGRVFFIIPWYGLTLLGTTDTDFNADINNVTVEQEDIDYLLSEVNIALKTQWTEQDIQGRFAGLRVLQQSSKNSPSEVTREWELKTDCNALFYSIGGKITSARADASQIVDAVCRHLGNNSRCKTENISLPWMPAGDYPQWSEQMTGKAMQSGIDSESAICLVRRHGKHVAEILQTIEHDQQWARRITATVPLIVADLMFCLEHEMVFHLEDLLRRRIPLLILYRMTHAELKQFAGYCAEALHWEPDRVEEEVQLCADKWLQQ